MIKKINFFKKNNNLKDSASCGDGPGQILKINYIVRTINALLRKFKYKYRSNNRVILLDSTGDLFDQKRAEKLLEFNNIMFVCGRYEGIDVRVNKYVDESFSIGNYIITGGELSAIIILDSIVRLIPGILGNFNSTFNESYKNNLLEYSQYAKPHFFRKKCIPMILKKGNFYEINKDRLVEFLIKTRRLRLDIWKKYILKSRGKLLVRYFCKNYFWINEIIKKDL
jgi:tRNA (guanine37-N1)-methyltransferase